MDFSVLRAELGIPDPPRPARQASEHARQLARLPARPQSHGIPFNRPDGGLLKALADVREQHAEAALGGLKPGMGVRVGTSTVPFRVADIDAATGRAHVREVMDQAVVPIGVQIDGQSGWCDVASLTLAPEHDAPDCGDFGKALAVSNGLRGAEAKIAGVRRRAADLVARTRAEASEALAAGTMTAIEAGEAEVLLGRFCQRMGL